MTPQPNRLAEGGRIDRSKALTFTVDGKSYTGHSGDTLASALLANGVIETAPSLYLGRPRGILAAGVEEPNALVKVYLRGEGGVNESMLPATTVELVDGLTASYLSGLGQLDPALDTPVYDNKEVHTHPL